MNSLQEVSVNSLPRAGLGRVLKRVDSIWAPDAAAHHVLYGQSGAGKSTLVKKLLGLCQHERAVIFDCKPAADPVWDGPPGDPHQWGRPVTTLPPRFGFEGERGGGPHGLWFRLIGGPDRADTARRFGDALAIIRAEGHAVVALDDVREVCRQLRLAEAVDSLMNLGRSNAAAVAFAYQALADHSCNGPQRGCGRRAHGQESVPCQDGGQAAEAR